MEKSYQDINAETIDRWCEEGWEWGRPISHEAFLAAKAGKWDVVLSPNKPVPHEWFGELNGKKLLGLASGGGQQMPIFAALGAECTVLDYSRHQLESERGVARREGYEIEIIRADMTKPLPFQDASFDIIFHPVSNCYVEQVEPIWQECFRILKPGGILLAGLDNGVSFWFDDEEERISYTMPFNPLVNPEHRAMLERLDCGMQFSHTIDEQIGGQLRAGFRLTHVFEDTTGEGNLHDHNIPCFWVTRSVKPRE